MTLQTIQFESVSLAEVGSGTLTAFLFSGATLSATLADITENGTLRGRYTGTVTSIAAGAYRLVVKFNGITISEPNEAVTLALAVGTYVATQAVELDSATIQEIADAVGGSWTVNVLPATGITADRSAGITLTPVVGETISQAITVYQSDGTTPVDLSGKTLAIIFETMAGADVAVVSSASITISGDDDNVVTFAYPSTVTATERVLRFAIRDAAAPLTMYLQGYCSVVNAPKVDT